MKQILLFLYYLGLVQSYILKCPGTAQWRLRSTHFCERSERYVCLYSVIDKVYVENCNGPRRETIGDKTVININGRFDNVYCSNGRFQPGIFSTSEGSECVFKKSTCSEEGQLISSNGSSFEDITCKCDYTRGYQYLSPQRHDHCSCKPLNEDCSCQIQICGEGETLSPDYTCVNDSESHTNLECSELYINQTSEEKRREFKFLITEKNDKEASFLMFFVFVVILLTSVTGVGLLRFDKGIYRLLDEHCYKEFFFKRQLKTISFMEYLNAVLRCEIRTTELSAAWFKDGEPISSLDMIQVKAEHGVHTVEILDSAKNDQGVYIIVIDKYPSQAELKIAALPEAKKQMSKEERQKYVKIARQGTELRHHIRVILIVKSGARKTSLLYRLLNEGIKNICSTDVVDFKYCKIRLSDGKRGTDDEEVRCYFCKGPPTVGCTRCDINLCYGCKSKHHSTNAESDHDVQSLCFMCRRKPIKQSGVCGKCEKHPFF